MRADVGVAGAAPGTTASMITDAAATAERRAVRITETSLDAIARPNQTELERHPDTPWRAMQTDAPRRATARQSAGPRLRADAGCSRGRPRSALLLEEV